MKTVRMVEAKSKLSRLIDRITTTNEPILITRNGRPAAVLMSADDFESLTETRTIQSDRELMGEIRRGRRDVKRSGRCYRLEELIPGD